MMQHHPVMKVTPELIQLFDSVPDYNNDTGLEDKAASRRLVGTFSPSIAGVALPRWGR